MLQLELGLAAEFAALLPLANLTALGTTPVLGNDAIPADVWVDAQGFVNRFATNVPGVGTIAVTLADFNNAIQVAVPPAAQTGGVDSTSGRQLFASGGAGTVGAPNGGNGGIIFGDGGRGAAGGRGAPV